MLEDRVLIWKFKCGSNEALCRIYRKYGDYLLALAAALLQDVNTAEDVVHDVFCKFIESREKSRRLVTSAEVLQELLHVYLPIRQMEKLFIL